MKKAGLDPKGGGTNCYPKLKKEEEAVLRQEGGSPQGEGSSFGPQRSRWKSPREEALRDQRRDPDCHHKEKKAVSCQGETIDTQRETKKAPSACTKKKKKKKKKKKEEEEKK